MPCVAVTARAHTDSAFPNLQTNVLPDCKNVPVIVTFALPERPTAAGETAVAVGGSAEPRSISPQRATKCKGQASIPENENKSTDVE